MGLDSLSKFEQAELSWRVNLWNYAFILSERRWRPYAAIKYISNIVQKNIIKGGARIIINIPPRHGKSELISHWLPVWYADFFPEKRIILTSYGDSLAVDWGRIVRDEIRANPLTITKIQRDKEGASDWRTTEGGGMKTAGVGGPILGRGGDLIIIDDPHKNMAEATSPVFQRHVANWFNSTLYTRLEPGASIVLIMQRWHEKDLTGYLLNEHQDDWINIKFPAIAEKGDLLGRTEGAALIPERYDIMRLEQIKKAVGSMVWAGMFQQRPAPVEGNIILKDWIRYYKTYPTDIKRVIVSWDMSFKKEGKSWCVGQVWCRIGTKHYLLFQERGKWDFTTALKKVLALNDYCIERWKYVEETIIEEAANGIAILSTLKGKLPRVKGIKVSTSKTERLSNAAPPIECGDVFFPDVSIAPWVDGLVHELISFPNAENDDQCDALSQYLNKYKTNSTGALKLNLDIGLGAPAWRI